MQSSKLDRLCLLSDFFPQRCDALCSNHTVFSGRSWGKWNWWVKWRTGRAFSFTRLSYCPLRRWKLELFLLCLLGWQWSSWKKRRKGWWGIPGRDSIRKNQKLSLKFKVINVVEQWLQAYQSATVPNWFVTTTHKTPIIYIKPNFFCDWRGSAELGWLPWLIWLQVVHRLCSTCFLHSLDQELSQPWDSHGQGRSKHPRPLRASLELFQQHSSLCWPSPVIQPNMGRECCPPQLESFQRQGGVKYWGHWGSYHIQAEWGWWQGSVGPGTAWGHANHSHLGYQYQACFCHLLCLWVWTVETEIYFLADTTTSGKLHDLSESQWLH